MIEDSETKRLLYSAHSSYRDSIVALFFASSSSSAKYLSSLWLNEINRKGESDISFSILKVSNEHADFVTFEKDGVYYTIMSFDKVSKDELFTIAEELIV